MAIHSSILAWGISWGCKSWTQLSDFHFHTVKGFSVVNERERDVFFLNFLAFSQFSLIAQSCPTLCDPMDCSTQAYLSINNFRRKLLKLMSIKSLMPSNHLILCCPLLLPPSIFPSTRIFLNESVLHIRLPKNWSFSFSISPSNEYSGLISFRID